MDDELQSWAAGRAPALLRRAEGEAVALLRDALLEAALQGRKVPAARPAPPSRAAPRKESPSGTLVWAYCVMDDEEPTPEDLAGVAPGTPVRRVRAGGLTALASAVPAEQFAAGPLRENLNDIEWLERVARAHEDVLERSLQTATIVPLRLCTIFEGEDGVRRMLASQHGTLTAALEHLKDRQEWGVKLLVNPDQLMDEARARRAEAAGPEEDEEPAAQTEGGAYMLRRRAERHVREVADALAAEVADDVHNHLVEQAVDAVTRPPQNRDLSGHEGDMLLNAAYLLDADRVQDFRERVVELQERHHALGASIELTGPWPPYNFVPETGAGPVA